MKRRGYKTIGFVIAKGLLAFTIFFFSSNPILAAENEVSIKKNARIFIPIVRAAHSNEENNTSPTLKDLTDNIVDIASGYGSSNILTEVDATDILHPATATLLSNCADINCLIDIGNMIKADYIISSQLGRIGNEFILTMYLVKTDTKQLINQEVIKVPIASRLLSACDVLTRRLLGKDTQLPALSEKEKELVSLQETMASVENIVVLITRVTTGNKEDEKPVDPTAMTNLAATTISGFERYNVTSKEDLSALMINLSERLQFDHKTLNQLSEIGKKLSARYLFYSHVGKVIDEYMISVNLIDAEEKTVVNRVSLLVKDPRQVAPAMKVAIYNLFGKQARLRTIKDVSRSDVLWRSSAVPGWGQFHNDKIGWGTVFVTGFVLTLGSTITSFAMYDYQLDKRNSTTNLTQRNKENEKLNYLNAARWATLGATVCVYVLNIVHAAVMDLPADNIESNKDDLILIGASPEHNSFIIGAQLRF